MGAEWTGSEFSMVVSVSAIAFFEPRNSRWRFASPFPGVQTHLDDHSPVVWTGRGWLFRGGYDSRWFDGAPLSRSTSFWYYDVATDIWTELPGISPIEPRSDEVAATYRAIAVLADGRIVALGEERRTSEGLLRHRDDVWVLNLSAELAGTGSGWTLTHSGQSSSHNRYWSATAFGCGVLSTNQSLEGATPGWGLVRFRLFDPTLAAIFEWPMPSYDWASDVDRQQSVLVFPPGHPGHVSLGDFGWGVVETAPMDESAPMQFVVLRR